MTQKSTRSAMAESTGPVAPLLDPQKGSSYPDAILVHAAKDPQQHWARACLYRRHLAEMLSFATRLMGQKQEGEDITQDSFCIAFEDLNALREMQRFLPWLKTIAVRQAHRRFRRQRLFRAFSHEHNTALWSELIQTQASEEVRAELVWLGRAISRLPADERITYVLRRIEGEELQHIAELLQISLATVKRRLQKAEQRLSAWTEAT